VLENLEITRRVLGPKHSDTLITMETLGDILKREGRLAEAEKIHRDTLKYRRETLGINHSHTALSFYKLACVLALAGKRDEAFSNLRSAVDLALAKRVRSDMEQVSDLKSLRGDPRFQAILTASRERAAATQAGK
jgi:hypothetical protein